MTNFSSDAEWKLFLSNYARKLDTLPDWKNLFATTVMKSDATDATANELQAHEDRFTVKLCKYLAATETFPNPSELKKFLCSTWVASIYPQHIRDSIYPSYVIHDLQTKQEGIPQYLKLFGDFIYEMRRGNSFHSAMRSNPGSASRSKKLQNPNRTRTLP